MLGGDYIYRKQSASDLQSVFDELARLRAPLGVYGVLGNHDHAVLEVNVRPVMTAAGIRELYDDGVWLRRDDARLRLSGLSGIAEDPQTVARSLDGATSDDFVLLVDHSPDVAEALGGAPVDLLLAGHTHGGQVTVFGLWAPFVPSGHGRPGARLRLDRGRDHRGAAAVLRPPGDRPADPQGGVGRPGRSLRRCTARLPAEPAYAP